MTLMLAEAWFGMRGSSKWTLDGPRRGACAWRLESLRPINEAAQATIATVEAAYELRSEDDDWFPELLQANLPLLDHGLGAGGLIAVKAPVPGPPTIEAMHVVSGPEDLIARHAASMAALPVERTHEQTTTGVFIVSERTAEHPEMLQIWRTFFDGAQDAIGLMTVDTDGRGIHILAPTPEVVRLTASERNLWEMMSAHVASGVRLRNALKRSRSTRLGSKRPEERPKTFERSARVAATVRSLELDAYGL